MKFSLSWAGEHQWEQSDKMKIHLENKKWAQVEIKNLKQQVQLYLSFVRMDILIHLMSLLTLNFADNRVITNINCGRQNSEFLHVFTVINFSAKSSE